MGYIKRSIDFLNGCRGKGWRSQYSGQPQEWPGRYTPIQCERALIGFGWISGLLPSLHAPQHILNIAVASPGEGSRGLSRAPSRMAIHIDPDILWYLIQARSQRLYRNPYGAGDMGLGELLRRAHIQKHERSVSPSLLRPMLIGLAHLCIPIACCFALTKAEGRSSQTNGPGKHLMMKPAHSTEPRIIAL